TKEDIIRLALRRLGLPEQDPPHVVMIGDRKHDLIGAHACGIPCIGVGYGYAPEGEMEAYHADAVAEDVASLGNLFVKQENCGCL
ncbi:MAG: HAD hydrolase-like protein, partial [Ruminococcus sp.]